VHQFIPTGVDAHQFDAGFQGSGIYGPDGGTPWQLAAGSSAELGVDKPIVLTWSNATGQVFERVWSVDKDFSLRLTDRVKNTSTNAVELAPYAQIHQVGGHRKDEMSTFVQFIGPKGWVDEHRFEKNFTDLHTQPFKTTGTKGWWGISSRYFISAIVPQGTMPNTFHFRHSKRGETDYYSAIVQPPAMVVAPGQTAEVAYVVYAGPKAIAPLAAVNPLLEKAVDYGWFDVIARPMFYALEWFHTHTGNWGVAIILLTLLIKLLTWPLASTSYVAMSRMKKLTPKMEQLKERYKDDKEKFAMEMMNLYKTEKVNPLSGCWPVLMQIPIFFAMYKVILVSFEFRQAPFFGWITDLSVMDPFFVLPIIMGASMWLQMKMNPPATDPVQQQVMQLMPIIFTVMFLWFPSGLVLYWLVNNVLSMAQQYWIMRKMGVNIS
jgi:YidC/Oxa1 family membrane protein insertase